MEIGAEFHGLKPVANVSKPAEAGSEETPVSKKMPFGLAPGIVTLCLSGTFREGKK